ncbi:MAG: dihydroorotase [Rikenellaceae bacterium]
MGKIYIIGAEVKSLTPKGVVDGGVAIDNGVIVEVGVDVDVQTSVGDEVVRVDSCTILPGFVDAHVHLREPGFEYKETIASGSRAAARGGVTTLFTMPNLNPTPDTVENVEVQLAAIKRDGVVNVIPYASITMGQLGEGELVDFDSIAPMVGGFSDDGRGVQSGELMHQAMVKAKELDMPIVAHCEANEELNGGYIHDGEYAKANGHRGINSKSEWLHVKRDIEIVEQTGCQYHVCHISTKESVALVREAKAKGLKVSCEVAPHYLLLTDMDLKEEGRFKMNPPIRSAEDRAALIEGLRDGTIDLIATDHAPHSAEEKSRGLAKSAFGVVGIEFSFASLYKHLVCEGVISLDRLMDAMAYRARQLFKLPKVAVEVGSPADLVAINLDEEYTINPAEFLSMGKATPMEGMVVKGRVKATLVGGKVAYRE